MIEVIGLSKYFSDSLVVDNLKFNIPEGQILGFLGPNGAGKSTTMKMLTCFLEPSSGTAKINGKDITNHQDSIQIRKEIGYLPESSPLYDEMTVKEFLSFISEIRCLNKQARKDNMMKVAKLCYLDKVWNKSIETLSKGYRQRVGFAQALIHDPPILILDEPTDGLDPNQKHEVRKLIKSMASDKTIILSTHILEEAQAVCQRILIINEGKLVVDSTPQKLIDDTNSVNLEEAFRSVTIGKSKSGDDNE